MLQSSGHVSSIIIPQNKPASVLVHPLKGHQVWTTLSRVKGGVKMTMNPETPCMYATTSHPVEPALHSVPQVKNWLLCLPFLAAKTTVGQKNSHMQECSRQMSASATRECYVRLTYYWQQIQSALWRAEGTPMRYVVAHRGWMCTGRRILSSVCILYSFKCWRIINQKDLLWCYVTLLCLKHALLRHL